MQDKEWKYYFDDFKGIVRVRGDEAQSWHYDTQKWEKWDYKSRYPAIGSYGWAMDFKDATPEEIMRVAEYYGAEGFTLDG